MLPIVLIQGCAEERGFQHGQKLRAKIHQVIRFYGRIFQKNQEDIFSVPSQEASHLNYISYEISFVFKCEMNCE